MAAYRALYVGTQPLPQWHLLTGSPGDIAKLWKFFHVYVHPVKESGVVDNWRTGQRLAYDLDHSDNVYFIDASGSQRYVLFGQPSISGGKVPLGLQPFMSSNGLANERTGEWSAGNALSVLAWVTGFAG